ncbi:MAG: sigma-54 dependent transcriptional regulator, partial [Myxococcota bacterium]|nr:sigma-54 dependent transcriptional regulator [Myxococcota bacterium]
MSVRPGARPRVLVVDDAEGIRSYLASLLELRGFEVDTAPDGRRALALLEAGLAPDVVVLDVMLPGRDGLATLRALRETHPALPVVMLSVVGRAETIVEAMQHGATDYVNKPFEDEELVRALRRALGQDEDEEPWQEAGEGPEGALWQGPSLAGVREILDQIAGTDVVVLIQGESGVGKEVVARAVHATSSRRDEAFVKVNCAALPGELLESELFGYEKGAFTGAAARRAGRFESAHGGTLFLDEIGEMSPAAQAKLLHVLQDGSFSRLGGNRELTVDVRVVTATNRPLDEMVAARRFREDLYFRLNVVQIRIPPLRERREEIPGLVRHFLRRYARRYGRPAPELSPRMRSLLERHDFPGNIRELENWMKRIVVLGGDDAVLEELLARERAAGEAGRRFEDLLDEMEARAGELPLKEVGHRASLEAEREAIGRVLQVTGW